MGKRFNVDGLCYPDEHYMVNIDNRLEQIQTLKEFYIENTFTEAGEQELLTD